MINRKLASQIMSYLSAFPVLGLTGPRQSGKSTLLQYLLPDYTYITFDDPTQAGLFEKDPKRFLSNYSDKVIFDEVHYVPEIFRYLKMAVDHDRQNYGKFVVTSSNQFSFLKKASESLAGRIGLLSLLPLEYSEMPAPLRDDSIFRGGYPELVSRAYQLSNAWYGAYMGTYLNKDIRELTNIGNIRDFQRLIRLLAARTSQILNMSSLSNDLGVSVNTIKHWISLLEASYIIFLLPPYYNNLGKRITKSPKIYFYDTGLVSYLVGIKNKDLFENGPMTGCIFENYVVSEIMKKINHSDDDAELFYYRNSNGLEIDLIVDWKTYQDFIEIKSGETFNPRMVAAIEKLMQKESKGYLLYRGEKMQYSDAISVINYKHYLDVSE